MTNKFKKAVQGKAAELVTAGTSEHQEVKENVEPVKEVSRSILDKISAEKPREASGKNKSVYFPNDVLEKVEQTAKEKGVTPNKLIISILREVLMN